MSVLFFCNLLAAAPPIKSLDGTHIHNPLFLAGAAINVALFLAYTGAIVRPMALLVPTRVSLHRPTTGGR